jgi:hypothetical protein
MNGTSFGQIQSGETVLLTALRVMKSLDKNGVGLHIQDLKSVSSDSVDCVEVRTTPGPRPRYTVQTPVVWWSNSSAKLLHLFLEHHRLSLSEFQVTHLVCLDVARIAV